MGLALAACVNLKPNASEITIGAIYNLTGSQRALDAPSAQGARTAVAAINRNGGVLGKRVALRIVDGESRPSVIARKTEQLFEENPSMPGVIGLSDTDMVLAAAPIAAKHQRVFLTSGATSPRLPHQVPEYLFLACYGDNVQAAVGAEWAFSKLGARQAMILYNRDSTYSQLLQNYFRTRFEALGGHIVHTRSYAPDELETLAIQPDNIDLVYLAATPDEVLPVLSALRKSGILAPVLGGDGLDIGVAWGNGTAFKDVFFTTHAYLGKDVSSPRLMAFKKAVAESYPTAEPDAFTALGFDCVNLLVEAIRAAGTTQPEAVRMALADINGYQGITGNISYRSSGQIPLKSVTIIEVDHGEQKWVGEYLPAKTPKP